MSAQVAKGKAQSRQSLAKYNRWLGWLTILLVILAVLTNSLIADDSSLVWIDWTMQTLVAVVPLVHAGLSMYLFGFPRFSSNFQTIHIYVGYALLLAILISQSLIGAGVIYTILSAVMYLLIVAHIGLGIRSWLNRRNSGDKMAALHRAERSGN